MAGCIATQLEWAEERLDRVLELGTASEEDLVKLYNEELRLRNCLDRAERDPYRGLGIEAQERWLAGLDITRSLQAWRDAQRNPYDEERQLRECLNKAEREWLASLNTESVTE